MISAGSSAWSAARRKARRPPTSQRSRPPIHEITAQMLLRAYALGIFPMAERRDDDEIYWVDPEKRGIIPFERFHLPRRLARTLRQQRFEIRCDENFDLVVGAPDLEALLAQRAGKAAGKVEPLE